MSKLHINQSQEPDIFRKGNAGFCDIKKRKEEEAMTTEEIAVKLEGHEHEIKSLKHRMDDQEEQSKTLNDLAISVKELAINMKSMIDEQKRAGERISKLESEPAERTKVIRNTIVTSIVSTIVGAAASAVIFILTQYLQQF